MNLTDTYLDQTHHDSVRAIRIIRQWADNAHRQVANWTPQPMPKQEHRRRCATCHHLLPASPRPWTRTDTLGNQIAWHTTCPDPKEARRG